MVYDYDTIIAMLESESELIDWQSKEKKIRRLAARAAAESSIYQTQETKRQKVKVIEGVAELPLGCYRFLVAEDLQGNEIASRKEGDFIKPARMANGFINIVYKSIPIDETGFPTIHSQQLNYVFWSIFVTFMRDMYIEQKLPQAIWYEINENKRNALKHAKKPQLTNQDWDKGLWLLKNGRYFSINPRRD